MTSADLKQHIIQTIGTSDSVKRKHLANLIIRHNKHIEELLDILLLKHPVSTRFSWLLGDLSSIDNSFAPEILNFSIDHYQQIDIKDINRVIAKQCFLAGELIPTEIEAHLIDRLFAWIMDSNSTISTKHYAEKALKKICNKYPELKDELQTVLSLRDSNN